MIIEQLSICAPKGQREPIGSALASLIGPTQVQPGCLQCRLLQNWHDADEFAMEANWATAEDLTRHLQTDAYKRLLLLMELSAVPPVLQFSTVQEVSGLDLVQKARGDAGSGTLMTKQTDVQTN
jgi:quinol monooxygenase YgiN